MVLERGSKNETFCILNIGVDVRSLKILHVFGQFGCSSLRYYKIYIFENHSVAKFTQKTYTCIRMCVYLYMWVRVGERDFPWRFYIVHSLSQIAIWYRFNWGGKTFWWFHHVWPIEFSFIFNDAWPNGFPSIQSTMERNSLKFILCICANDSIPYWECGTKISKNWNWPI